MRENKIRSLWLFLFILLAGLGLAEARTLWVNQATGSDSNNGLSSSNAKETIQSAFNAAQNNDLIIIVGDADNPVSYYERPTLSGLSNLWILAEPRGGVVISGMIEDPDDGTQSWASIGDNKYTMSLNDDPHMMSYQDSGGTDWWLARYTLADLDDHVGNFCSRTANIPEYGFAHSGSTLTVRLPNNDNPNGKKIRISRFDFSDVVVTMNNADNIIWDGMTFEGGEFCIDADSASTGTHIRNVDFRQCKRGAEVGNNALVEWSRYGYPGYEDFLNVTHTLDSSEGNSTAWDLAKDYAIIPGDCTSINIEGSMVDGHNNTTGLELRFSEFTAAFEHLRLFGLDGVNVHHNLFRNAADNIVEFESDSGAGGANQRFHHNYLTTRGFTPISLQSKAQLITATVDHNVIEFLSDSPHQDTVHALFKNDIDNTNTRLNFYNNTVFLNSNGNNKEIWQSTVQLDQTFTLRNNIFIAGNNIESSYGGTVSNNILVRSSSVGWLVANGGFFRSTTGDINFVNEGAGDYGITSGSIADGSGFQITGITDSTPSIGAFEVGETPGVAGTVWPRGQGQIYDTTIPAGWSGDVPPGDTYVAASGGGGTACTNSNPCTFSTGQSQVQNGETIILKNGTYSRFNTTKSGITYQAQNQHQAIISHASASSPVYAIGIGDNNTTIDGLRIDCNETAGGSGHGCIRVLSSFGSGFTIRNSIVENSAGSLINVCGSHSSNCSDILIEDNILRETGFNADFGEGLYIAQFEGNNTVNDVVVRRNTFQGIGCEQSVDVKPGGVDVEVYFNIFENQTLRAGGGCNFGVDGVIVSQGDLNFHDNIIRNNNLNSPSSASVLRPAEDGNIIRDNVIYGNTHGGALIRPRSGGSGVDTEIFENVFCDNSNNTISGSFNDHDNISHPGSHQDCTDKENEILALIGEDPEPEPAQLIAHLTFDNTLADAQGNVTPTYGGGGSPVYVPGITGPAISLDGDNFVSTGTHSITGTALFPIVDNPFSVAAFFKTDEPISGTVIASAVETAANRDFQIFLQDGSLDTYLRGDVTASPLLYNDGEWHHVAVVWNGTSALLYIDGDFIGGMEVGSDSEDTGEDIIIGARTGGAGFPFTGSIDDVRIYNYAISSAEVSSLAGPLIGSDDISTDLIAHWTFNNTLANSAPEGTLALTHSATPAYVSGQIGNAITLPGDEFLTAGVHQIETTRLYPGPGNPFTVAGWMKTDFAGTLIASAVADPFHRDFQIAINGDGAVDTYLRGVISRLNGNFNDDAWHHVAVTWNGTTADIYIDNVLRFDNANIGGSPEDTGEEITAGARTGGTGFHLTGEIDDLRLYARALDPAAINVLFNLTINPGDTTPPSVPLGLQITQNSSGQQTLAWNPSTDDSGEPLQYHIESCDQAACADFAEVGITTATQFTSVGLAGATLYRYRVRAKDEANNFSDFSAIAEGTTLTPNRRAEREGGTSMGGFFQ